MRVLVSEVIWQEGIDELKDQGFEVVYDEELWTDRERLVRSVKEFDGLIVRNQTKVDEELLQSGEKLKVIGRLGVGLDNINIKAAKEKGIDVVFAKNANATSVAEYVMSAILSSNRSLFTASQDVLKGTWDRRRHTGGEIYEKTIGLIGLGEIAHRVAKRAKVFGMDVVGYDPFITEYEHIVAETGVNVKNSLEEVLAISDFVSIHVPLNPSTTYLLNSKTLKEMKPNAFLINTSRGGIVDEEALAKALREKHIGGAFLDVLEKEPIDSEHPLLLQPDAIITPHIAGLTNESQVRTSVLVAKEVSKILKGSPSLCVV
ncbi:MULTISPECIES: hydroxyacid dehydrogenase [Pontibacillus]|uniref:Hydroxyacid dehydrogenase n=1 Tax=Pontibacillus chungwhensis TaxID=265426 RepID=A0ABY8V0U7_9BACI|nr:MULTISPECIES: hydroxyacid dehydrogenase [Pontibacillus]MCD5325248.1 hydroxyacid dehydrogenase [Pontibacillus sp. HN14]WIF97496.1 hydroxyacid dehydrogenase [Pontibacillus chungwhensis]